MIVLADLRCPAAVAVAARLASGAGQTAAMCRKAGEALVWSWKIRARRRGIASLRVAGDRAASHANRFCIGDLGISHNY